MADYREGLKVKHGQYGLGTIVASDEERTSIDFTDHGTKKFVTSMVVLEISSEQPEPRAKAAKKPRRAPAKRPAKK